MPDVIKDNIVKIIIALIVMAMGYLFTAMSSMQRTIFMSQEHGKKMDRSQEQNVRQWLKIIKNSKDVAVNQNDIKWLKKEGR